MVFDVELIGLNSRMASKRTQIEFIESLICGLKTKAEALVGAATEARVSVEVVAVAVAPTTATHYTRSI